MKLITFESGDRVKIGVYINENEVVDINSLPLAQSYNDMNCLIECPDAIQHVKTALTEKSCGETFSVKDIRLLPPIPNPRKDIICLGLNYMEHIKEGAAAMQRTFIVPSYPVYFSKRVYKMMGPDDIISNTATNEMDYEAELAVVIGKEGRDIPIGEVEKYIFGYTILNDLSARELQRNHSQWFKGKSLDGFTSIGPCIVTADELPLPLKLDVRSRVNGEARQNGNTGDFIFDIATIISDLSRGMTLLPGDIISTGTPSGVGMGFDPPRYLKPGDVVECEIEGIGILRNRC